MTDYRSDVLLLPVNSGQGAASPTSSEDHNRPCQRIRSAIVFARRPSGPAQAIGRDGKSTPCPSSAMSSGRLFLNRVARPHGPSPLRQHPQLKTFAASNEIIYHRTVTSLLTVCLTAGDKSNLAQDACSRHHALVEVPDRATGEPIVGTIRTTLLAG